MKKSDLKTGMVVQTRTGDNFLVMSNPDCEDRDLICFSGSYMSLKDYTDTLEYPNSDYDIVKVFTIGRSISYILSEKDLLKFELIWERDEPKEMTVGEIEEELGFKIKIVGDRNENE